MEHGQTVGEAVMVSGGNSCCDGWQMADFAIEDDCEVGRLPSELDGRGRFVATVARRRRGLGIFHAAHSS
ncbi:hypothetical protein D3C87_1566140 [compost metagenome]